MENDTIFVRMRSGDHLETQNVEKEHLTPSYLTFFIVGDRHKTVVKE